jgi:hypothetical protein
MFGSGECMIDLPSFPARLFNPPSACLRRSGASRIPDFSQN